MTKKEIFDNRLKYSIPDVPSTALWCDAMFEWLFGRAKDMEYTNFLMEEIRLQTALTVLLDDTITPFNNAKFSLQLFQEIEELYPAMQEDLNALLLADPAAKSRVEIIAAYPGFYAVVMYRIAHLLWKAEAVVLARLIAEYVHSRTGIDIHPAAEIGKRFVIDHGTGVVIGETTVIGHDVKIYQGVTLGAASVSKEKSGHKRHPSLGNHVVVYANATILGGETRIGDHAVIGGNVWLTRSVPSYSLVYHKSEIVIKSSHDEALPEPLNFVI